MNVAAQKVTDIHDAAGPVAALWHVGSAFSHYGSGIPLAEQSRLANDVELLGEMGQDNYA